MIGIYKITSPSKKIYIGQSINIERRFNNYKNLINCKGQTILYNSFLKHGIDKHVFEILCECEIYELNDKERYYQDLYSVIDKKGMNCRLTSAKDRSGKLSEEIKNKISLSNIGKKQSIEQRKNTSILKLGNKNMLGKNHSTQTKNKISKKLFGRKIPKEVREKMSISSKNRIFTDEHKKKISLAKKGKYHLTKEQHESVRRQNSKIILDTETGCFYYGLAEASIYNNIGKSLLSHKLNGRIKNNTNLIYV